MPKAKQYFPLGGRKMRCAYLDNPLGIDQSSPRLSWQIKGLGVRGEKQNAYHIRVASSLEKLEKGKYCTTFMLL
jgi:alpha-L-rhamnosidase